MSDQVGLTLPSHCSLQPASQAASLEPRGQAPPPHLSRGLHSRAQVSL